MIVKISYKNKWLHLLRVLYTFGFQLTLKYHKLSHGPIVYMTSTQIGFFPHVGIEKVAAVLEIDLYQHL